jgi:hypothetical protein
VTLSQHGGLCSPCFAFVFVGFSLLGNEKRKPLLFFARAHFDNTSASTRISNFYGNLRWGEPTGRNPTTTAIKVCERILEKVRESSFQQADRDVPVLDYSRRERNEAFLCDKSLFSQCSQLAKSAINKRNATIDERHRKNRKKTI